MPALSALEVTGTWRAGEVAIAVVDRSGVIDRRGPTHVERPLASVTKLFTTLAVLVGLEEGIVALDDPVGPPGATLRHLLAHASGCAPDDRARVVAPPGKRRVYSNAGIELAASHLEERSGLAFVDYLQGGVLEPLGAATMRLVGSPAHGGRASIDDLVALVAELLAARLLAPETLALATRVAFPGLAGVVPGFGRFEPCDWGLGFELASHKRPHWMGTRRSPASFGHFGQSGSFCFVEPDRAIACVALCEVPFGPWAATAWPLFFDILLAELDS